MNNPKTGIESQKISITKIILGKIKARNISLPDFKLYYRAVVIKAVGFWYKNRHTDQQNSTENPEINPRLYGQLGFPGGKESVCQCRRHEIWFQSLAWEDILEKEMATHSGFLAWKSLAGYSHRVTKSQTGLKQPSTHAYG